MDLISAIQGYFIIALTLAWTTYIMIWRPACQIIRIELEYKDAVCYRGIQSFILWTVVATILAPGLVFLLLTEDNFETAVDIAEKVLNRRTE